MFTDAYWPRVNGVTVSVDSFSRALVNEGHEVMIVCSSYPQEIGNPVSLQKEMESEKLMKIVKVPSLPFTFSKEDRIAKLNKFNWVFKQVDAFNPDIIHMNTEMVIAEFGFLYARTHNLPDIYTLHTMWEDYTPYYFSFFPAWFVKHVTRKIMKNIIKRPYRVIVPTLQIEEFLNSYKLDIKPFLLPTGIDINLFKHSETEKKEFRIKLEELYPHLKNKRILLFAGRIGREKNIGFLLNIFPDIFAKHPDIVLLIAGNGPDLDYYREEARSLGIEDNCVFPGYFIRSDLALVYSISEIFLFPSLTDTQGLVTLEAMLSGTPVVAIGALGTITVMGGDNGGFMVKDDKAEFTARVIDLLDDHGLRERKSREATLHAQSWSIDELTKKLAAIYKSVISDYTEEFGHRIVPVWELVIQKRWWKINNMILKKKTKRSWQKILSKLKAIEN